MMDHRHYAVRAPKMMARRRCYDSLQKMTVYEFDAPNAAFIIHDVSIMTMNFRR